MFACSAEDFAADASSSGASSGAAGSGGAGDGSGKDVALADSAPKKCCIACHDDTSGDRGVT